MRSLTLVVVIIVAVLLSTTATGQYSPMVPTGPSPIYQKPQSYTSYYNQQLRDFHRPPVNARNYTIDKYFLRNENLSPYLNLTRRTTPNNINNYYRYVRPEQQRRERSAQVASVAPPPIAFSPPANPGHLPVPNPYFNQYYKHGSGAMPKTNLPPPTPLPKLYP